MKRLFVILSIALVHLAAAVWAAVSSFEMSGWMFGVYPPPDDGVVHRFVEAAQNILMFPLGQLAESLGPDADFVGWSLVVLNSLLWAVIIYAVAMRLKGAARQCGTGLLYWG